MCTRDLDGYLAARGTWSAMWQETCDLGPLGKMCDLGLLGRVYSYHQSKCKAILSKVQLRASPESLWKS